MVAFAAALFPAAVSAATLTVCTGTLTGGTYENVKVPAGALCTLDDAHVTGSITVREGGTLVTDDSLVDMNVIARDAASVELIDTVVLGEINLQRTSGRIVIGSEGCAVDPVADGNIVLLDNEGTVAVCYMTLRNLIVQGNSRSVGLFNNDVSNDLVVTQNSGPAIRLRDNTVGHNVRITQNTSTKVIAVKVNTVAGNIRCTGNAIVPTVVGNTVTGAYLGQCAA